MATYPPNEVSRASGRYSGDGALAVVCRMAPRRRVPYGAFPLCDGEGAIATEIGNGRVELPLDRKRRGGSGRDAMNCLPTPET